jgi:hypothetical protein
MTTLFNMSNTSEQRTLEKIGPGVHRGSGDKARDKKARARAKFSIGRGFAKLPLGVASLDVWCRMSRTPSNNFGAQKSGDRSSGGCALEIFYLEDSGSHCRAFG